MTYYEFGRIKKDYIIWNISQISLLIKFVVFSRFCPKNWLSLICSEVVIEDVILGYITSNILMKLSVIKKKKKHFFSCDSVDQHL